MLLNEHDSKRLFAQASIRVPEGVVATPADMARPDFAPPWFAKAQVLTGGRGKAGGIRRIDDPADLEPTLQDIFAMTIKGHAVPRRHMRRGRT